MIVVDVVATLPSAAGIESSLSQLALIERDRHLLRQIARGVPLTQVLEELLRAVDAQSSHHMRTSVLLVSDDGRRLHHGAGPNLPDAYNEAVDGILVGEGVGSCGTAASRRTAVRTSDIAIDPLWKDFRDLALEHGLRACWSTPITAVEGEMLGTFAVYYGEPRTPTEDDETTIASVTQTVALAIERHRSDLALRRSQDNLKAINADLERQVLQRSLERGQTWQVSPDLLSVIDLASGTFDRVNPAWTPTLGWGATDLEGASFKDLVHPDDLEASYAAFEEVRRGNPVLRFENRYRGKDGSYRVLSWVSVPEGAKLYSSARDVTDEKAQTIALVERTRERDLIWEASKDLLCVASLDGWFIRLNPAWSELLDRSETELKAQPFLAFVHPDDREATMEAASKISDGQPVFTFENRYQHKDGSYRWLSWNAVPREGQIYATVRDVTKEKAQSAALASAEDALRQAQKMEAVGQLTGGVAHDFNNLLTVIKSSTDLLKRPSLTQERRERYVDAISDTVDRAAKLTAQLLAFARRQALKPEVFSVGDSVQAIGEMMRTLTGSRIKLVVQLPDESCFVSADPSQFDTALVNMAVNARDAMDGEGQLTISVRPVDKRPTKPGHSALEGAFVAIAIADTGSGISDENLKRIFEPFFTTKGVGQGTGLGLSQVFGFAKQSGGDVSVKSEAGKGTTFTLCLPRTGPPPPELHSGAPEPVMDGRGTCVLIVEDNVDVGVFATQTLAELGYLTVLASNASEALAELDKDAARFDAVFTDVVMPGASGVELAQTIRHAHPHLPVVLTSGYSHVLAQHGTHGFELLHKPYSVEQLSRILSKAAGQRRGDRNRELQSSA